MSDQIAIINDIGKIQQKVGPPLIFTMNRLTFILWLILSVKAILFRAL